jgi:hypothetical protein
VSRYLPRFLTLQFTIQVSIEEYYTFDAAINLVGGFKTLRKICQFAKHGISENEKIDVLRILLTKLDDTWTISSHMYRLVTK